MKYDKLQWRKTPTKFLINLRDKESKIFFAQYLKFSSVEEAIEKIKELCPEQSKGGIKFIRDKIAHKPEKGSLFLSSFCRIKEIDNY